MLAEGPQSADTLAGRMNLPLPAAGRLLAAAVSLKLVDRRGDQYGLGSLGAAMVDNPGLAAMVDHNAVLYGDLQDPVALLRGAADTRLGDYWAYSGAEQPTGLSDEQVAAYTALMAASQPMIAEEVLDAYRLDRFHHLLDVGGGDGSFAALAAARYAELHVTLFDLPPVAERARSRFTAAGLEGRASAVGGDFLADTLPTNADIVSLVRVIHDHDDPAALAILRAAHQALRVGGTLLLAEPMAGTPGAEPVGDAYFGFYLLAMGRGRLRTASEFQDLLAAAGFARGWVVNTRMPLLTSVIVAAKIPDVNQA
jgi:demethylspheroidene O-methyltransferase